MKQFIAFISAILFLLPLSRAQECTADCVWPGDLNANGIANYLDFLAFGFSYETTGPARADQSTLWAPYEAENWVGTLPTLAANFKHSDADGNGVVDEMDQLVIAINYNQTNPNFTGLLGHNITGNDLFAVLVDSVVSPGGSLVFDIHLGTATNPVNDIYGIGFQITVDTQYIQNVLFDYSENWLGMDEEVLVHDKYSDEHDFIGMAMTRFDGNPVSGFGRIARLEIVITDVVLGLEQDSTACLPFPIVFENVLGINEQEEDKFITTRTDTMGIKHPSQLTHSRTLPTPKNTPIRLYPNPSSGQLYIESEGTFAHLQVYNQLGALVLQRRFDQPQQSAFIDFARLNAPAGLYFLRIGDEKDGTIRKVLLE